jgi:hypothetical protein
MATIGALLVACGVGALAEYFLRCHTTASVPRRVQNPNVRALIPLPELNLGSHGSISAAEIGTTDGTRSTAGKQKTLRMQGFEVAGAGF